MCVYCKLLQVFAKVRVLQITVAILISFVINVGFMGKSFV